MSLGEIFDIRHIKMDLVSDTKMGAFGEMVDTLLDRRPHLDRKEVLEALTTRENQMSTGIIPGAAVPHGYCSSLEGVAGAIGISRAGIIYDTEEQRQPVHCIFMFLMGTSCREKHLQILGNLLNVLNPDVFPKILAAESALEIHNILCRF